MKNMSFCNNAIRKCEVESTLKQTRPGLDYSMTILDV